MGYKVRKKPEEVVPLTDTEVKDILETDPFHGREYLDKQLRRVFVPTESSVVLN